MRERHRPGRFSKCASLIGDAQAEGELSWLVYVHRHDRIAADPPAAVDLDPLPRVRPVSSREALYFVLLSPVLNRLREAKLGRDRECQSRHSLGAVIGVRLAARPDACSGGPFVLEEAALEVPLAADLNVESEEQKRPEQDCSNCGQHLAHGLERIEVVVDCGDDDADDDPNDDGPWDKRSPVREHHVSRMLTHRLGPR